MQSIRLSCNEYRARRRRRRLLLSKPDMTGQPATEGIAVLCSLHQVAMVAGFADRVLGLRGGEIVLDVAGAEFDERHHQAVHGVRAG